MNKKKAYIYKMNLVPANVLGTLVFILIFTISTLLNINFFPQINTFYLFILMILYLWCHELLHGIGYIIGGVKRKNIVYGVLLEKGILYCVAYQELTKKNILISLLMPFMVIGVFTYIIGAFFKLPLLVFLSIVNICGASMDLAMFYYISKLNKDTIYTESGNSDEFVLISSDDLTKNKNIFFEIVDIKDYDVKDYIFDNDRKFEITKNSILYIVVFLIIGLFLTIFH